MSNTQPVLQIEQVQLSAEATRGAKGAQGYSSQPGLCAQFCRLVHTRVLGAARSWQPGPDAIGVARILRERGHELPPGSFPEVGDMVVLSGPGHGPHGHIMIRVIGNRFANNSTWNYNQTGDARGFRPLSAFPVGGRVFRLWERDSAT